MKYKDAQKIKHLLQDLETGRVPSENLILECKEAIDREIQVLIKRAEISHINLTRWKYRR